MGNTQTLPWNRTVKSTDPADVFHTLDVDAKGHLTLKDLMAATNAGLLMPHSLPALYFCDEAKDGTLTQHEFVSLVRFCHSEKEKVEAALAHDKPFRDLILRASRAGVKDCSVHGRSSYRRFSSYSNVKSVFSSKQNRRLPDEPSNGSDASAGPSHTPLTSTPDDDPLSTSSPAESMDSTVSHHSAESPVSSDPDAPQNHEASHTATHCSKAVSMYATPMDYEGKPEVTLSPDMSDSDLNDPRNRTALDAAVMENIMKANIHRLADALHEEGQREKFMDWLWNLVNFNGSGVVTLEELRIFLKALSDDGIDLEELVFYKEVGVPLEECVINEFDTTHAGLLSRDEFMVLADLVTREYEFWENRNLERIGDYQLGRTLGRGSSGVVRLAMHVETRERVAVKIIKKGKCSYLSRLDREIQSLMAAKHKNIVGLHEVLDSKDNLFIVMELCGGGSLVDIVRLYPEERMPEGTARFFLRQVFEALAFCHRNGICHRDVRLDNLMLDNEGNVKITDFGHSGIYTPGWDIFSTSLVGSLYNLSPEQIGGSLYSGEKIDIWSTGVAVYCLLVGRPPFYDPELQTLLDRIAKCEYDIPDFLSAEAVDLVRCMIRPNPEERITMQHLLHHPWFYDGPECSPSMKVVVIPVDYFFKQRPDIAEMVMAITIYQHNLHFHLGDAQNPTSSPEDHRGQEWTLKCLDPKNDIKFTITLFTKEPTLPRKKYNRNLSAASSCSSLPTRTTAGLPTVLGKGNSSDAQKSGALESHETLPKHDGAGPSTGLGARSRSSTRPPHQRRRMIITPVTIAAHIRDANAKGSTDCLINALLDLERDPFDSDTEVDLQKDRRHAECHQSSRTMKRRRQIRRKKKRGNHHRTQSMDEFTFMRTSRSVAMDAFPYQKVYPTREMPEDIRNDFSERRSRDMTPSDLDAHFQDAAGRSRQPGAQQLTRFHRSVTLHAVSSYTADYIARSLAVGGSRGNDIASKLSKHPSKAVSPQSPTPPLSPDPEPEDSMDPFMLSPASPFPDFQGFEDMEKVELPRTIETKEVDDDEGSGSEGFQPYLEVRLSDGESGVFLKICRKLKTICATKLASAAVREQEKRKTRMVKEFDRLRRSGSLKSIHSDVTADEYLARSLAAPEEGMGIRE